MKTGQLKSESSWYPFNVVRQYLCIGLTAFLLATVTEASEARSVGAFNSRASISSPSGVTANSARAELNLELEREQGVQPIDNDRYNHLPQTFDGETLDTERAEAIVTSMGVGYIGHDRCPVNSDDCAIFYVADNADYYTYQVASERCQSLVLDRDNWIREGDDADSGRPLQRVGRATLGTASQPTVPVPLDPTLTPILDDDGRVRESEASVCFAGYTTMFRIKQEGLVVPEDYGYFTASSHLSIQTPYRQLWRTILNMSTTKAQLSVEGTGLTHELSSYVITDEDGVTVDSHLQESQWIASSGGQISDKDLCDSDAAIARDKTAALNTLFEEACSFVMPMLNVGVNLGIVSLEGNRNLCGSVGKVADSFEKATYSMIQNKCYHEINEPTIPADVDYIVDELNPEKVTLTGESRNSCPAFFNQSNTQQSSDGIVECNGEAFYSCSWKSPPGQTAARCVCEKASETSVCVDLDPQF